MPSLNLYNNIAAQQVLQQQQAQENSPYAAFGTQGPPAMQGESYDKFKSGIESRSKDNALVQATKDYDVMEHPGVLFKNWLLCVAMSMGFTGLTNHLMKSKEILPGITNADDFKSTRLYKAGEVLDDKIGNSSVGRFFSRIGNSIKSGFSKIPVPGFVKEITGKMRMGSISVLDKQGMYTLGKGAEALNEFMEYVSKVPEADIKQLGLKNTDEVLKVLKDYRAGNLRGPIAFERVAKYFADVPAEKLAKLSVGKVGILDKVLRTTPDINLSLNKARFFNGSYNTTQGPIAKAMQKLTSLVGEASGGGVLGGKMALLMNTIGLMTGFNAASNAEKGDKLKAFMEDYIGFTLGSYLMSFYVGTWFNKSLGVTELGLDKKAVAAVGKKLGVDMTAGRLQDAVIAYNKAYRLSMVADDFRNNSISFNDAVKKAVKYNVEGAAEAKTPAELLSKIRKALKGRSTADLDAIRGEIKDAFKSKLTLGSVLKETEHNKGNFLTRACRYIVQKPLSMLGRLMSIGRYDMLSGKVMSGKGLLKWSKRFGGGLGRALFVMFVLVEPFRKGFMKLSHMIFGKPKHSMLDEENKEKAEKEAEKVRAITDLPQQTDDADGYQNMQYNQFVRPGQVRIDAGNNEKTNILNNIVNGRTITPVAAAPIAAASIASSSVKNDELSEPLPEITRNYIPSSDPAPVSMVQEVNEDKTDRILRLCDSTEKNVLKYLQ